jgi:hypothetical protein
MRKILLAFLLLLSSNVLFAQGYEKEYEKLYAWEVKQVDEFIERFNNDSTLIKQYTKKNDAKAQLTREKLIKSLFNAEGKNWNFVEINSFIKTVNDPHQPLKLKLSGDNLNAKLLCSIKYKHKPETATLILKLEDLPNGSSKWVITDVEAAFLKPDSIDIKQKKPAIPLSNNSGISFIPTSHNVDFMNIDVISKDKKNIANYFVVPAKQSAALKAFVSYCYDNTVEVKNVSQITYTINQIKGWTMEVQQFTRETKNCGWLISKLTKTTVK